MNAGKSARLFTAAQLVMHLAEAKGQGKLKKALEDLGSVDLLVIDELGYVPLDVDGARLLFQVMSAAETGQSMVITTNIEFSRRGTVFGDDEMASAIVDRLVYTGRLVEFNGTSYRMENALMLGKRADSQPAREGMPLRGVSKFDRGFCRLLLDGIQRRASRTPTSASRSRSGARPRSACARGWRTSSRSRAACRGGSPSTTPPRWAGAWAAWCAPPSPSPCSWRTTASTTPSPAPARATRGATWRTRPERPGGTRSCRCPRRATRRRPTGRAPSPSAARTATPRAPRSRAGAPRSRSGPSASTQWTRRPARSRPPTGASGATGRRARRTPRCSRGSSAWGLAAGGTAACARRCPGRPSRSSTPGPATRSRPTCARCGTPAPRSGGRRPSPRPATGAWPTTSRSAWAPATPRSAWWRGVAAMPPSAAQRDAAHVRFRSAARAPFLSNATVEDYVATATAGQLASATAMLGGGLARRGSPKGARLLRQARLPVPKSFEGYDWSHVSFPEGWGREGMLSLAFVGASGDLVLHGPTGRGRTHCATALGMLAVARGVPAGSWQTAALVMRLGKARREGSLDRLLADLGRAELLVPDEFGYVPLDVDGARLPCQVVADSHERRSVVLTTNVGSGRWGTVLADDRLAAAMVDRVVHHGRLVESGGPSHRLENSLMLGRGPA